MSADFWARRHSSRAIECAVVAAAGLYFGLLGPFGNYVAGEPAARILYWTGTLLVGSLMISLVHRSWRALTGDNGVPDVLGWLVALVIAAVACAFLSRAIAVRLWPVVQMISSFTWYLQVVTILAPLTVFKLLMARSAARSALPVDQQFAGLAPERVECITVEDHYVRVHDRDGSRLVYGTFKDAVSELGRRDGLRVHRSWWVAREAVDKVVFDGRRVRLELRNGIRVPVSRSCIAHIKAAGWISAP